MRKNKLCLHVLFILMMFYISGCSFHPKERAQQIERSKDFTIFAASDLHYLSNHLTDQGEAFQTYVSGGDGKQLSYIDEILYAFRYDMTIKKPDVLVISGDLTNNGEELSHQELSNQLDKVEENGVKVYVIPGNHDINNPWARGFRADKQYLTKSISADQFINIYSNFGYREAVSRDKGTLSYLAAPSKEVWLLMLDTNKYQDNMNLGYPETGGVLTNDTLEWIKKCGRLAEEQGARLITVMHHNILNHSDLIKKGFTLDHHLEALKIFNEIKIHLVLSGHIHIQDIASLRENNTLLYDIASNALSVSPHQYGILSYKAADRSIDYHTARVDVEAWAKAENINDSVLTSFSRYSEEFFGNIAYDKAFRYLTMAEGYSGDQIRQMSDILKILNIRYFAGTEYLNSEDIIESEGYRLWQESVYPNYKRYIQSMLRDNDTDDNQLRIELQ